MYKYLFLFSALCTSLQGFCLGNITVSANDYVLENSITKQALADFKTLVSESCNCQVSLGSNIDVDAEDFEIYIEIWHPDSVKKVQQSVLNEPVVDSFFIYENSEAFTLIQYARNNKYFLLLVSPSYKGIANGIYGFMQENLGYAFYHPKENKLATLSSWPVNYNYRWRGEPRFKNLGFHINNKIPTELSVYLAQPNKPNHLTELKGYIDWLARNGQNYVEFSALRATNLKQWPMQIDSVVAYAHSRGIKVGLEVSLIPTIKNLLSLNKHNKISWGQVSSNLAKLFVAKFDALNVENFNSETNTPETWQLLNEAVEPYNASVLKKAFSKTSNNLLTNNQTNSQWSFKKINTSYFELAPFLQLNTLINELNYINQTINQSNIDGYLNITTGLEWGTWFLDWSLARFTWQHKMDNLNYKTLPIESGNFLFGRSEVAYLEAIAKIQYDYLYEKNLADYVQLQSIVDKKTDKNTVNATLKTKPISNKYLRFNASIEDIEYVENKVIDGLFKMLEACAMAEKTYKNSPKENSVLFGELKRSISFFQLNTLHRIYILQAIVALKRVELGLPAKNKPSVLLAKAEQIRSLAQKQVEFLEDNLYRYKPINYTNTEINLTDYTFGYLTPVKRLNYLKQEENQVKNNIW